MARLKVYYPYRCGHCGTLQYRGSSAMYCNIIHPLLRLKCCARIYRVIGGEARTRPPRLTTEMKPMTATEVIEQCKKALEAAQSFSLAVAHYVQAVGPDAPGVKRFREKGSAAWDLCEQALQAIEGVAEQQTKEGK